MQTHYSKTCGLCISLINNRASRDPLRKPWFKQCIARALLQTWKKHFSQKVPDTLRTDSRRRFVSNSAAWNFRPCSKVRKHICHFRAIHHRCADHGAPTRSDALFSRPYISLSYVHVMLTRHG
jgi:hypothetical protein